MKPSRFLAGVLAVSLLVVAGAGPAFAVVYGSPDGNGHPNVGALLANEAYSDGTWADCTGTLISSTVFLTAAHCSLDQDTYAVTFDPHYVHGTSAVYWGTWHADPRFRPAQNNPYDLAVVVFDDPIPGITPADLPEEGSLDNLAQGTLFTGVGYGAEYFENGDGLGHRAHYSDTRNVAVGSLITQTRTWLKVSLNPALGWGGPCNGDSGGPNFLGGGSGETNILAATTVTGDFACRSTNVEYRLDTEGARWFVGQYVSLP